ncbi:hypothetical protein OG389_23830 [Streptomyces sp. NBC_00435]|uniref:hypothetical protein n=1 Tax=Streptomyces sp. NBC_00435 TaxID=2903649 RepID=UPI002E221C10
MSARRSTLTALGATTLLAVLWFVPSANATGPGHANASSAAPAPANDRPQAAAASGPALELADTGGVDTTPYLLGGTLCLGAGAGFVAFSVRRSRTV